MCYRGQGNGVVLVLSVSQRAGKWGGVLCVSQRAGKRGGVVGWLSVLQRSGKWGGVGVECVTEGREMRGGGVECVTEGKGKWCGKVTFWGLF